MVADRAALADMGEVIEACSSIIGATSDQFSPGPSLAHRVIPWIVPPHEGQDEQRDHGQPRRVRERPVQAMPDDHCLHQRRSPETHAPVQLVTSFAGNTAKTQRAYVANCPFSIGRRRHRVPRTLRLNGNTSPYLIIRQSNARQLADYDKRLVTYLMADICILAAAQWKCQP